MRFHPARPSALTLFTLWSVLVCLSSAQAQDRLRAEIESVLNRSEYKEATWGLLVVERETGKTVYEQNPDKLFVPASTIKLYTVAAALDALGADYRFQTPIVRRGNVDSDGVLHGDLILIASGDLTMGGRTDKDGHIAYTNHDHVYASMDSETELTAPDPLAGLNDLARQVAASGIRRVTGDVLVDDRLFEKAKGSGSGPGNLTPIVINDNLIDITVTPTAPGVAANVRWRPESLAIQVDAQVQTVESGKPSRVEVTALAPGRLVVRGQIATDANPLIDIHEAEDAASFARALCIEALNRAGVRSDASALDTNHSERLPDAKSVAKLPHVAQFTSPPFSEEVRLILKVSHNLHAGTLPLLLAVKKGKRTLEEGLRLERDFLKAHGVDTDTISFGSGAGGSLADSTTPRATVQLLRYMVTRPDFNVYDAALPVLGVDGTLSDALDPKSPARGKIHAKTGTFAVYDGLNNRGLLRSKALAGYLTTAHGRNLIFAFFVNNTFLPGPVTILRESRALGKLCEILYEND